MHPMGRHSTATGAQNVDSAIFSLSLQVLEMWILTVTKSVDILSNKSLKRFVLLGIQTGDKKNTRLSEGLFD